MADTPLETLQRWERMGGEWRVVGRSEAGVEIELLTCTGGEVMDRLTSADPDLLAYLDAPLADPLADPLDPLADPLDPLDPLAE